MESKGKNIQTMFDGIAHRYDLLNHLLSAGTDNYWRRKALKLTRFQPDAVLLDVACGTGDVSIQARKMGVKTIFGADFALKMLNLFEAKSDWMHGRIFQSSAEQMPLKPGSVTNITISFGVRNFYDIPAAFSSFHRVLRKGGKTTILEFSMPRNPLLKGIYRFYFKRILPGIGKLVSKHPMAYTYLPESVEQFDRSVNLPELLKAAGFSDVEKHSLTFGLVQVVIGRK